VRARAQIESPNAAELTLTLTMRVGEWKDLAALLPEQWPAWPVASLIRKAIRGTIEHVETAREVDV
jgi:hypothetical protein